LGKTSNAAKQRWNKDHYIQFKVWVRPETVEEFKAKCKSDGVSMASEVASFMHGYCNKPTSSRNELNVAARKHRRKALGILLQQLEMIRDAELQYQENIPENLVNSIRYEAADQSIEALQEAIDKLNEVYE